MSKDVNEPIVEDNKTEDKTEDNVTLQEEQSTANKQNVVSEEGSDKPEKVKANDTYALKGIIKSKDQKLEDQGKTIELLATEIESIKDRDKVKDMLIDSDLPEPVKTAMKADFPNLTTDNFEERASKYTNIYKSGLEDRKQQQVTAESIKPDEAKSQDFKEKLRNAKTREEIIELTRSQA